MFLGVNASTTAWSADGSACTLLLDENPLADFVELPEQYRRAWEGLVMLRGSSADATRMYVAAYRTATCCVASSAARWRRPHGVSPACGSAIRW